MGPGEVADDMRREAGGVARPDGDDGQRHDDAPGGEWKDHLAQTLAQAEARRSEERGQHGRDDEADGAGLRRRRRRKQHAGQEGETGPGLSVRHGAE